ncbi:MAG: methylated-DNA--[protein]-cysteine S-methyltransferase [Butyrivibrio sp.]|nr:methylated-DNA--[protein]-cysteine S-methyltransferase [Muribaculum sp.]MCM1552647.1 methylated-DNA--[protein]-cysteine S-methyltransferase [Butyrivibrio sp.]
MQFTTHYQSPIGGILLAADEIGLTGLWFDGGKYYADCLAPEHEERDTPILKQAKEWLTIYFAGRELQFSPPVHMIGTPFQLSVWKILQKIPYGKTITYGEIAKEIAAQKGLAKMSAQAVGGAVGHNKISIIVPCHRVVGTNGSLTGYAGGIDKKVKLLTLEKADMQRLFIPTKGTAL